MKFAEAWAVDEQVEDVGGKVSLLDLGYGVSGLGLQN